MEIEVSKCMYVHETAMRIRKYKKKKRKGLLLSRRVSWKLDQSFLGSFYG